MTKVLLQYGSPAPDGTYPPVEGVLIWTPTRRRVVSGMPDKIIMPIGFKVPITGGVITVNVAPSGIDWVWRVDELVKGMSRVISYKAIPDQEEIDFTELVSVNPLSLSPLAEPEPIWYPWAEALAETTARAEQSAEDSKLAAIESQDSAQASATAAAGSATEAYNYMQGAGAHANYAGSSAFGAGDSMFKAQASEAAAKLSEDAAEAAKSDAFVYRDGSQIARTYAEVARDASIAAKDGSEAARDQSIELRDEAIAARGATVSTGLVDENGHLILSRNDTTEVDAGYVIGPPINLTITDTNTSPSSEVVVGPQGPIGPKGDPGGWLASTVIAIGASLDTITTSGLYLNPSSNWAMGPANATTGGHLEVISSSGYVYQRYVNINEQRKVFTRTRNSAGTWTAWRAHNTVRVDQTAGRSIYMWDDINSRDQLIYGDTGWRDLTPVNGWTATSLKLRRIGQTVYLHAANANGSAATTDAISEVLGVGFRCNVLPVSVRVPVMTGTTTDATRAAAVDISTNNLRVFGAAYTALTAGNIYVTYPTIDTWPTTLPGTASGSIPNT
ncbi:minor tail protein [Arthrobacter phage Zeina]|nr:minor tail protein [Arthrobacter phage Zeina]